MLSIWHWNVLCKSTYISTQIIYTNSVADYSLKHWYEEKIHPLSFCFQWSVFCIDFERTRIKLKWNPSVSDTVVGGLLGHEAHGVVTTGLGELPHLGPLVCIGVIVQHVSKCVPFALNPLLAACNDASWKAVTKGVYISTWYLVCVVKSVVLADITLNR